MKLFVTTLYYFHILEFAPFAIEWIKEGSIIGGHVENLVLATYTPLPTIDYTNSIKKHRFIIIACSLHFQRHGWHVRQ